MNSPSLKQTVVQADSSTACRTSHAPVPELQPGAPRAVVVALVDDHGAAKLLNIGFRTFLDLVASADWLPTSINLGRRLRRWDPVELLEAVRTRGPRGSRSSEPAQLARARIERLKRQGVSSETN